MYFAVPCFFMISGATLLDYRERFSTRQFFIKRINKTLIPFLFWSIIGVFYRFAVRDWSWDQYSVKGILLRILNTNVVDIYWFFPALFGLYLSIPILAAVPKEYKERVYMYFTVCAFVLNSVASFLTSVFAIDYHNGFSFTIGAGYLQYLTLGWLIDHKAPGRNMRCVVYLLGVGGLVAHIVGTAYLSSRAGEISMTYKGYTNVPCVLYSAAVFLVVKTIVNASTSCGIWPKVLACCTRMSGYTFGVYLIHWFVLDITLRYAGIDNRSIMYRVGPPLFDFSCFSYSDLGIRKIPFGKRIIP